MGRKWPFEVIFVNNSFTQGTLPIFADYAKCNQFKIRVKSGTDCNIQMETWLRFSCFSEAAVHIFEKLMIFRCALKKQIIISWLLSSSKMFQQVSMAQLIAVFLWREVCCTPPRDWSGWKYYHVRKGCRTRGAERAPKSFRCVNPPPCKFDYGLIAAELGDSYHFGNTFFVFQPKTC